MAHTRIRKFNTKITYPEQKLDNDLCQAVVARGTMVFLRGQIGQNLDTSESVCIGDAAGQAEQAMFNINSKDKPGEEPGLWSLAMAMGTPAARSAATGGRWVSRKK